MAVVVFDYFFYVVMILQGYGVGIGMVGDYYEQGNWYWGGVQQMFFIFWLYWVQNGCICLMFFKDVMQEEFICMLCFFDFVFDLFDVDWKEVFRYLLVKDIIENVDGLCGIYSEMIQCKFNDLAWFEGGLYYDIMGFGVLSFWFIFWYDVFISFNFVLFNYVCENLEVGGDQYLVIVFVLYCVYICVIENMIVGECSVGDVCFNYDELIYGWFDYWLKDDKSKDFV